jgi:hypothetical protein
VSIIPVRVPANARPVLATERRFNVRPDHPLYEGFCAVCEGLLGETVFVLVFAGIEPESRKPRGFATGAAVAVHAFCAGVPGEEPQTPPRTVTYDLSDPAARHALTQALTEYADRQADMAVIGDSPETRLTWAARAKSMLDQAGAEG